MHGLTGGDWKRNRNKRKPRQSPTLQERGQLRPQLLDGRQQEPDLPGPGDYSAVDLLGDLGCLPGDLAERVGGQDVQLHRVAEDAVEDRPLAGDRGGRRGAAVHGQRQRVQRAPDQLRPPVLLIQRGHRQRVTAQPGQRRGVLTTQLHALPVRLVKGPPVQHLAQLRVGGYSPRGGHQDRCHGGQRVGDRGPALGRDMRPFQVHVTAGQVEPRDGPMLARSRLRQAGIGVETLTCARGADELGTVAVGLGFVFEPLGERLTGHHPADAMYAPAACCLGESCESPELHVMREGHVSSPVASPPEPPARHRARSA
jgi:hypothetical protein